MKNIPGTPQNKVTRLGSNPFTNNAYEYPIVKSEETCPRCGSDQIIRKGYRERGVDKSDAAQRCMCKFCKYKFTLNPVRKTFIKQPTTQPIKQPSATLTTYFKYR